MGNPALETSCFKISIGKKWTQPDITCSNKKWEEPIDHPDTERQRERERESERDT